MNILIIGGGGREHAIALQIAKSPKLKKMYCVPGNPGIAKIAECANLNILNNELIANYAEEKKINLAIIGPEAPLCNGLADYLTTKGIKVFGPNKRAAQFEGSKSFARDFMAKYSMPSPDYKEFTKFSDAKEYLQSKTAPIVIKADGLAAGKGVLVADTIESAVNFTQECLLNSKFGDASNKVVIEDCLIGEEGSYLVFCDGTSYKPMPYSQDHKPIGEGDTGLNTGGMGAYSPAPILQGHENELDSMMQKFINGVQQEGIEFKGVLYIGLMKTKNGLKILEFNCRFGDPETQIILPRMDSDLVDVMLATIEGRLSNLELNWKKNHCVTVVLASGGYPENYEKGKIISGLNDVVGVQVIHAGTKKLENNIVTNGGRVLNVVGVANNLQEAVSKTYKEVEKISFEGVYYRKDIAKKELDRQG